MRIEEGKIKTRGDLLKYTEGKNGVSEVVAYNRNEFYKRLYTVT